MAKFLHHSKTEKGRRVIGRWCSEVSEMLAGLSGSEADLCTNRSPAVIKRLARVLQEDFFILLHHEWQASLELIRHHLRLPSRPDEDIKFASAKKSIDGMEMVNPSQCAPKHVISAVAKLLYPESQLWAIARKLFHQHAERVNVTTQTSANSSLEPKYVVCGQGRMPKLDAAWGVNNMSVVYLDAPFGVRLNIYDAHDVQLCISFLKPGQALPISSLEAECYHLAYSQMSGLDLVLPARQGNFSVQLLFAWPTGDVWPAAAPLCLLGKSQRSSSSELTNIASVPDFSVQSSR